ncbi:MAG: serine protease [Schwartzia sp.]|nr:serine protease [Schwartzia sp. (in: firmicutes)]
MEEMGAGILQVLLLAILFLGLLVEFKTGGLGVGAMLGITAAGVFFGSRYVQGLVSMVQIGIFLAGVLCIVIEMLAPTVGLLAGLGVAAMLYSVVLALGGTMNAVGALVAAMAIAVLVFVLIVKRLPSSKLWRHLVLHDSTTTESGYVSAETRAELVGCTGRAETELRPSGRALVDGQLVDVVSEGAFIGKGAAVTVVSVNGSRVVVRENRVE